MQLCSGQQAWGGRARAGGAAPAAAAHPRRLPRVAARVPHSAGRSADASAITGAALAVTQGRRHGARGKQRCVAAAAAAARTRATPQRARSLAHSRLLRPQRWIWRTCGRRRCCPAHPQVCVCALVRARTRRVCRGKAAAKCARRMHALAHASCVQQLSAWRQHGWAARLHACLPACPERAARLHARLHATPRRRQPLCSRTAPLHITTLRACLRSLV